MQSLAFFSCIVASLARRLDTKAMIDRPRNYGNGAGRKPHLSYAGVMRRGARGARRPRRIKVVSSRENKTPKNHFQGIAILGLDMEDPHLTEIANDLYMYTGISGTFSTIGEKAVVMTKMGVDSERQGYLKKKGRFATDMADAWLGALESRNRLVLIVKTEEDRSNIELKIKVGFKLNPADAKAYGLPSRAGVSIIDVADLDGALVTREIPRLLPGHKSSRHSSDYNIKELFNEANSTAATPRAASAATSLFWIILHEVIVHDWLKLSHNYFALRGASGYRYLKDDAMNKLTSWRSVLGVPDRLGHPSMFDRQDGICGYLFLDPLRTYFGAAVKETSNSIDWWEDQRDPSEYAALGFRLEKRKRPQRKRLYDRFREMMRKLNREGAPFLDKRTSRDFFTNPLYSGTLLWSFFDDKDIDKPPADQRTRLDPVWMHRRLGPLKAYLGMDPHADFSHLKGIHVESEDSVDI